MASLPEVAAAAATAHTRGHPRGSGSPAPAPSRMDTLPQAPRPQPQPRSGPWGPRLQRPLGASRPLASRPRAPQVPSQARRHLAEARQPVCLGKRGKRGFWGGVGARAPLGVRPADCQAPLYTPAAAARRPQALHVLGSGPQRSDSQASSPPPALGAAEAAPGRLVRPQTGPPGQASPAAPLWVPPHAPFSVLATPRSPLGLLHSP